MLELCKLKKISFLVFTLFFIPIVYAAQIEIQQIIGSSEGLILEYPNYESVYQNKDFFLHVHVFNETDGILKTDSDTSCLIHIYNNTGNHILKDNLIFDDGDNEFELLIDGGNFTRIEKYSYIIQCNTSNYGGAVSGLFDVVSSIEEPDKNRMVWVVGIILTFSIFLLWLGIKSEDAWAGVLSGFLFMLSGIFTGIEGISDINNYWVSGFALILIGFGFYIIIRAFESIDFGNKM